MVQLSHPYMTAGKTIALTRQTFVSKVMSLLLNTLSRFVIAFLPGSNCLLISWLQSPSTVILEPKKIKSVTVSTLPPSICHGGDPTPWSLLFECRVSNHLFHSPLSPSLRLFSSSSLSAIRVVLSPYLMLNISSSNIDSSL